MGCTRKIGARVKLFAKRSMGEAGRASQFHSDPNYVFGLHPLQGADLVAVGVAQIGEVELAGFAFAHARRVFAGFAAVGDAGGVPGIALIGRLYGEADRAAVRVAGLPSIGFDTANTPLGDM